ncbi:efflux transporter outer membrane subunit [Rugosibacter aromaticivorans]|nr:efflux transporter outer membrane subunit [Rugosibacter aromaticivorans]
MTKNKSSMQLRVFPLLLSLFLGGCSFAPPLSVPEISPAVGEFKEEKLWVPAQPADSLPRDAWWALYGDAELDALQKRLIANSADLAAALARYQQAVAYNAQIRSALFPTVDGVADARRNRQSEKKPLRVLGPNSPDLYNDYSLGVEVNYELDLWGRVRNQIASATASEKAAQADLESARLSLQAQLADYYFTLRGLDQENSLLNDTVTAYAKALEMARARHDGGLASGLDVARAQTQYDAARSQASQTLAARAQIEHAIAALVGEPASTFAIEPQRAEIKLPNVPAGMPSTLLQRRPDIAAAQRRIEAANAQIGVARAAYFPSIMLGAVFGYQSSDSGDFIKAPNRFWSIGPSLVLSLFDAGRRQAEVSRTEAALDELGARYRSVALGAFQQVEDNLALLKHYHTALEAEQAAAASAQRSLDFATSRYRDGGSSYLEVVSAQTAALQAQRSALDINTRQLRASVQLIRALGGGWSAATSEPLASATSACAESACRASAPSSAP